MAVGLGRCARRRLQVVVALVVAMFFMPQDFTWVMPGVGANVGGVIPGYAGRLSSGHVAVTPMFARSAARSPLEAVRAADDDDDVEYPPPDPRMVRIHYKKETFKVGWNAGETVGDLRDAIKTKSKIPLDQQELMLDGEYLANNSVDLDKLIGKAVNWETRADTMELGVYIGPPPKNRLADVYLYDLRTKIDVKGYDRTDPEAPIDWPKVLLTYEAIEGDEGEQKLRQGFNPVFWAFMILSTLFVAFQIAEPSLIEAGYLPKKEAPVYKVFVPSKWNSNP